MVCCANTTANIISCMLVNVSDDSVNLITGRSVNRASTATQLTAELLRVRRRGCSPMSEARNFATGSEFCYGQLS